MDHLYLSNVGDGLCLGLLNYKNGAYLQFDCGNKDSPEVAVEGWRRIISNFNSHLIKTDCLDVTFVLSHFHEDHYNGLYAAAETFPQGLVKIEQLYYPGIPQFEDSQRFYDASFAMMKYTTQLTFGKISGLMDLDLIKTIKKINGGTRPGHRALFKGDPFTHGEEDYECMWPPEVILDTDFSNTIKIALREFDKALDKNEDLRKIYQSIKEDEFLQTMKVDSEKEESSETDQKFIEEYIEPQALEQKEPYFDSVKARYPKDVQSANSLLRKAANSLCLVLRKDKELLLWGDLSEKQIGIVMRNIPYKCFRVMVAPHHGTKWHREMNRLRIIDTLVPNGEGLQRGQKIELGKISSFVCSTYYSDDILMY